MRWKTVLLTGVVVWLWLRLLTTLLEAAGSGEETVFYVSMAMTAWLIVGYRRLFGGIPVVETPGQAIRAFLLALCWPAVKGRR
jgi:hypothetical protein